MPVLLGEGLRLFDDPALGDEQPDKLDVHEVGGRTILSFRVKR